MGEFISKGGVWHPVREKLALKNKSDEVIVYNDQEIEPGEEFIYDGPDREAVDMIQKDGNGETIGTNFKSDPEFLQSVRNMGFNSTDEYLKTIGYDEKEVEKKFKEKASSIKAHTMPMPKSEVIGQCGGTDTTGNSENDIVGGFGSERIRPAKEVKKVNAKAK